MVIVNTLLNSSEENDVERIAAIVIASVDGQETTPTDLQVEAILGRAHLLGGTALMPLCTTLSK